jgi:hypothetical protein
MRKTYRERKNSARERERGKVIFFSNTFFEKKKKKLMKTASSITQVSTMPQQSVGNKG